MIKHHSDETQRLEVKQYFEAIKKYAQSIPEKRYPHQNRYIALLHLLSDSVSSLTRKRMEDESEPAACEKGCDACCYFAVITVSRSELDEIRYYLNAKQDEEVGVILKRQWSDWETQNNSAIQPCPFLLKEQGRCSVYPVRPMACRLLLSSRKCSREDESSGEFQSCQKFTRLGWQEMPLRPDTLLKALESQRSGRLDFEPGKLLDEEKIDLKAFTPEELWTKLNPSASTKTQDDSMALSKKVNSPTIP